MNWRNLGPDFTGWLRAPQADRYLRFMDEERDAALNKLLGAAAVSEDPKVRAAWFEWSTRDDMSKFLHGSRKESVEGDDE